MNKIFFLLAFLVLGFFGCNQEELEKLKKENEDLKSQKEATEQSLKISEKLQSDTLETLTKCQTLLDKTKEKTFVKCLYEENEAIKRAFGHLSKIHLAKYVTTICEKKAQSGKNPDICKEELFKKLDDLYQGDRTEMYNELDHWDFEAGMKKTNGISRAANQLSIDIRETADDFFDCERRKIRGELIDDSHKYSR